MGSLAIISLIIVLNEIDQLMLIGNSILEVYYSFAFNIIIGHKKIYPALHTQYQFMCEMNWLTVLELNK